MEPHRPETRGRAPEEPSSGITFRQQPTEPGPTEPESAEPDTPATTSAIG